MMWNKVLIIKLKKSRFWSVMQATPGCPPHPPLPDPCPGCLNLSEGPCGAALPADETITFVPVQFSVCFKHISLKSHLVGEITRCFSMILN